MAEPRNITDDDLAHWSLLNPRPHVFTGPGEKEAGIEPCQGIITDAVVADIGGPVVRVPWRLDEIEVAHLARGGTLWLSTWGGLPVHSIEVQEPT